MRTLGRLEPVSPGNHERHPDTSLVQRTLAPSGSAAERTAALEILHGRIAVVGRAVVGGDYEDGIVPDAQFLEFCNQAAHLGVDVGHHGGIRGVRITAGQIHTAVNAGLLVAKFLDIVHNFFRRGLHGAVRHCGSPHGKERTACIIHNKLLQLVVHKVGAVKLSPVAVVIGGIERVETLGERLSLHDSFVARFDLHIIFPQMGRIVRVCESLAVETIEIIEAHFIGSGLA